MIDKKKLHQEWQNAGITNDFIFGNVMQEGDNCRNLIQAALPELHLKKIKLLTTQKDIQLQQMMHGVRLDVFAEDDQHRLYDLEMQVCNEHNLGQRSRYYQAKIDANSLRSGQSYQEIKRSYLIFLLPFDPFGCDQRQYSFLMQCQEVPGLRLNTQSRTIFFNSHGTIGNVTPELQGFFDLMNCQSNATNSFTAKIESDINKVKADPIKEAEYMDLAMKLHDERQAGIREGRLQGKQEGLAKGKQDERIDNVTMTAQELHKMGLSSEEIHQRLQHIFHNKLSDQQINKIVNQLR